MVNGHASTCLNSFFKNQEPLTIWMRLNFWPAPIHKRDLFIDVSAGFFKDVGGDFVAHWNPSSTVSAAQERRQVKVGHY